MEEKRKAGRAAITVASALVLASAIATTGSAAERAGAKTAPQETVFSSALRFQGDVVDVLQSGKAIHKTAYLNGRKFEWAGRLTNLRAAPEAPVASSHLDIDSLSVAELAENLRGIAFFQGHQFVEAEPAYDLAHAVKQRRKMELEGATEEEISRVFPDFAPSLGNAKTGAQKEDRMLDTRASARGGDVPTIVHGVDDRRVMNNRSYPYRTNIVFDNTGASWSAINGSQGSGTMIGPSTAMSVAHVFWDEGRDTWEAAHKWAPGFDSQDADPSPYGDWFACYWVTIPTAYLSNESQSQYDYAVLNFNVGCNSWDNGVNSDRPGSTVGWLGTNTASAGTIESRTGYVRGYPGIGTCGNPGTSCNVRVWGDHSWSSENDATSIEIRHQADTSGGMSGSAFYQYLDPSCSGCGYGAYLTGMHRAGSSSYNIARRYTGAVYNFMRAYSSDY